MAASLVAFSLALIYLVLYMEAPQLANITPTLRNAVSNQAGSYEQDAA
jgi:hypothetical protein